MSADPARVKEVFGAALERTDPMDRAAYLAGTCGSDADLRRRVEALLRASEHPDSFLDHGPVPPLADVLPTATLTPGEAGPDPPAATPEEAVGTVVAGRYKLLELIGEGGMVRSGWPNRPSRSSAWSR